jgi:hypothetical protein
MDGVWPAGLEKATDVGDARYGKTYKRTKFSQGLYTKHLQQHRSTQQHNFPEDTFHGVSGRISAVSI